MKTEGPDSFLNNFHSTALDQSAIAVFLKDKMGEYALRQYDQGNVSYDLSIWVPDSGPQKGWALTYRERGGEVFKQGEFFINFDGSLAKGTVQTGERERRATQLDLGASCAAFQGDSTIIDMLKEE